MNLFRPLLALATASALSACAPSPLLRGSLDTLKVALADTPTIERSRAEVEANPEPQIKLGTPYGEAIIVLWRIENGQQFWGTSSRQALVTQHGLVRRTIGFPSDLTSSRFLGADPFAEGLHLLPEGATSIREIDWKAGNHFGIRLHSRFSQHGMEKMEILGVSHELLRVDEQVHAEGTDFQATNRYWVDPDDGVIHHSLQHLGPDLPVTLTLLRPYRERAR